jgi:hypothetical protein
MAGAHTWARSNSTPAQISLTLLLSIGPLSFRVCTIRLVGPSGEWKYRASPATLAASGWAGGGHEEMGILQAGTEL